VTPSRWIKARTVANEKKGWPKRRCPVIFYTWTSVRFGRRTNKTKKRKFKAAY
jgi:hypothetical protein